MDGDEWQELTNHDTTAPVNWNGETEVGLDEKVALLLWTTRRSNCYGYHITETLAQREAKLGTELNSVALSPQANYTDWATATCQRNLVPTFVDRGVKAGKQTSITHFCK
jgi:hypothetical protein